MTVRILLVDDSEIVRMGVRMVLADVEGFEVVGEAGTADESVARARELLPDIVLMDVRLPDRSGIEACRDILAENPTSRVIMLTSHADDEAVVASILAGAQGFVMKEVSIEALTASIHAVSQGETILSPTLTRRVLEKLRGGQTARMQEPLTQREVEILFLIGEGLTNREIAQRAYLSENTVRNYVSSILRKRGFKNRSQAAVYAQEKGQKRAHWGR